MSSKEFGVFYDGMEVEFKKYLESRDKRRDR